MLVPQIRVIAVAAVVLLPLAAAAGLREAAAPYFVGVAAVFVVAALLDAAVLLFRREEVTARFPDLIRMTKDRTASIVVTFDRSPGHARRARAGLNLPIAIECEEPVLSTEFPADSPRFTLTWPCTPVVRGEYTVENVYIEDYSPMSLWARRRCLEASGTIRVYPNFHQERAAVAGVFLNRGGAGLHLQRQVGKGREFEQLRDYIPGDSYEDVSWKATARRGIPVTKMFQVERTQEVYVIVDSGRLSGRQTLDMNGRTVTLLERYINVALLLALVAQRQGDLFGLAVFSDSVNRFLRAGRGAGHFGLCRDALYTVKPSPVNPDFEEVCAFLRLRLRKRALLVFLTNLDDPVLSESFQTGAGMLSRKHLIFANLLVPERTRPVFEDEAPQTTEGVYDRLARHLEWTDLLELRRELKIRNVDTALLRRDTLAVDVVTQYINQKQRQLL